MSDRIRRTWGGSPTIGLAAWITIALLLLLQLVPGNIHLRTSARAAESKSGLHEIQKAVEKYHRDNGCYPSWLIGGAAQCATIVDSTRLEGTFQDIQECSPLAAASDPLLREGYLKAYPANPFVTAGIGIHQVQANMPASIYYGDPLRNGTEEGALAGTRFGPECKTMGNVMGDPRQREWVWTNPEQGYTTPAHTYADVDFHHWDMWVGDRPQPFLYGQFFYKAHWKIDPPSADPSQMLDTEIKLKPPTMYMLGAYGGPTDRGLDVIGKEHYVVFEMGELGTLRIWPWTRSTADGMGTPEGSPYGPAPAGSAQQVSYGNPNGIDDAVVLLLTSE